MRFKDCEVIMLPSKEKAPLIINQFNGLSLSSKLGDKYNQGMIQVQDIDLSNKIYQHLYILSNEEIKVDGDWYYNTITNAVFQMKYLTEYNPEQDKKIIATTDSSIALLINDCIIGKAPTFYPKLSLDFINQFIEEYNKGNLITKVMVEYEESKCKCLSCGKSVASTCNYSQKCNIQIVSNIKINPDNTINMLQQLF